MNMPLSSEKFQFKKIYNLFIKLFILFKLIYIISPVRGSLHSMLEGALFTEELYRAMPKKYPVYHKELFSGSLRSFLEKVIWVCINLASSTDFFHKT